MVIICAHQMQLSMWIKSVHGWALGVGRGWLGLPKQQSIVYTCCNFIVVVAIIINIPFVRFNPVDGSVSMHGLHSVVTNCFHFEGKVLAHHTEQTSQAVSK